MKKILIMGLPDAGKTTLAKNLKQKLESMNHTVSWYNADEMRKVFNDWDFSNEGRIRQAIRMKGLADKSRTEFVIIDIVAPLPEMRDILKANIIIWMDTIKKSVYEDTNKIFVCPNEYTLRIKDFNYDVDFIANLIVNKKDVQQELINSN